MTFVGIALAIGLHIDVGIVVRSLADSIGMVDKDDLPLPIERQFMFLLSSKSGHARKEVCDPVDEYAYSWWLQKGPFGARPLCRWTLEDCLYTHRQVQQDAGVFRNSTTHPVPSPELSATDTPRSPPVPEQYRCQTCILYRHACGALQSDLVQIKAFGATQLNVALVKTATARTHDCRGIHFPASSPPQRCIRGHYPFWSPSGSSQRRGSIGPYSSYRCGTWPPSPHYRCGGPSPPQ